jgi:energy-converting hydrogenase Eha subunit A
MAHFFPALLVSALLFGAVALLGLGVFLGAAYPRRGSWGFDLIDAVCIVIALAAVAVCFHFFGSALLPAAASAVVALFMSAFMTGRDGDAFGITGVRFF